MLYVYRANLFIVGNMLINRRALKQNHSLGEKHLKYTGLLFYMEDFGMGGHIGRKRVSTFKFMLLRIFYSRELKARSVYSISACLIQTL